MRKRLAVLLALVVLVSVSLMGTALADNQAITPYTAATFASGLDHISGNTYEAWASVQTATTDKLFVSFTLYRKSGSTLIYVASGTASQSGTYVEVSKDISLSAGSTYELHTSYSTNTQSDTGVKTYAIK